MTDYSLLPAPGVRLGVNLRDVASAVGWRVFGAVACGALAVVELAARARAAVRMAPAPAPTPPPAPPPCRSGRCILGAENCDNPDHRP
jgi:hypothetical protein